MSGVKNPRRKQINGTLPSPLPPLFFFSFASDHFLNSATDRLHPSDGQTPGLLGGLHHAAAGLDLLQPLGEVAVVGLQLVHLVQR